MGVALIAFVTHWLNSFMYIVRNKLVDLDSFVLHGFLIYNEVEVCSNLLSDFVANKLH